MDDYVKIPETADEAAAMLRVSALWLHQKAPNVLRAVMATTEYAKDAERWRWLRKEQEKEPSVIYCCWPGELGRQLDAAIDSAMADVPAVGAA